MKNHKLLIFSGVKIDQTPVIREIEKLINKNTHVKIFEYRHRKRIQFILTILINSIFLPKAKIIFIGAQTYPALLFISYLRTDIFYWSLESYTGNEDNSFISKIMRFEKIINWKSIRLIIPIEERKIFYNKFNYKALNIIPNSPNLGRTKIDRGTKETINFIIYGNLNNEHIYLSEWIDYIKKNKNVRLTLIGNNLSSRLEQEKFVYLGFLNHAMLIEELSKNDYNFTIIGYRPIDFNHKYCAPNKLFEAFSLSLPVIVNKNNPTLERIISEDGGGLICDFSEIPSNLLINLNNELFTNLSQKAFENYENKYNLQKYVSKLNLI